MGSRFTADGTEQSARMEGTDSDWIGIFELTQRRGVTRRPVHH